MTAHAAETQPATPVFVKSFIAALSHSFAYPRLRLLCPHDGRAASLQILLRRKFSEQPCVSWRRNSFLLEPLQVQIPLIL